MQAVLQQLAQDIFPEGQGKLNSAAKLKAVAGKTNALFINAKKAIGNFFMARGYEPRRPEYTKSKLGYPLDQYEAIAYVTTRAMGYSLISTVALCAAIMVAGRARMARTGMRLDIPISSFGYAAS